jgi:hypothetical protein
MAYSFAIKVQLGPSLTGKTLRAQLKDTSGADVGGAITTGFIELGGGEYGWSASIPHGFRGWVVFSDDGTSAYYVAASINPEETEVPAIDLETLAGDYASGVFNADLAGDVSGRVIGGGGTAITGVGAWAVDGTGGALATAASVTAVKTVTDHLATALELNAGNYRFTVAALANGGTLGTDAITAAALSAAAGAKIADIVHRRTMTNVFASANGDAVSKNSLAGWVQMGQKSSASGTTLTVLKPDGSTLGTFTLTVSAGADPVSGIG